MAATAPMKNAVEDDANWTLRIRAEQAGTKRFAHEWGFLSAPLSERRTLSRSVSPVKYIGGSSWTVKNIRVPDRRGPGVMLPEVTDEKMRSRPLRPSTAMESVVMSNILSTQYIHRVNPFYITSSHTYGSRLPLEQFGVAQHAIRASRTKLPSH